MWHRGFILIWIFFCDDTCWHNCGVVTSLITNKRFDTRTKDTDVRGQWQSKCVAVSGTVPRRVFTSRQCQESLMLQRASSIMPRNSCVLRHRRGRGSALWAALTTSMRRRRTERGLASPVTVRTVKQQQETWLNRVITSVRRKFVFSFLKISEGFLTAREKTTTFTDVTVNESEGVRFLEAWGTAMPSDFISLFSGDLDLNSPRSLYSQGNGS